MEHQAPPLPDNVMDLLLDAICVVDAEGRFVFVSAAFETIFGYSPAEIIGTQMLDLVHPEERERTLAAASAVMGGKSHLHFQNRYVRKDGRVIHVMWSARWSDADRMRIAVARDITELKRAEATQAAVFAISESAHTAEDLPSLFERIHAIIGGLLSATNFFVALYDAKADALTFPYYVDEYNAAPEPRTLDSGTLSAEVIRTGQPLFITADDHTMLSDRIGSIAGRDSLEWLGVPLRSQERVFGALVVQSYSGDVRYTEQDIELLKYVSDQVAMAIERKQAQARLQYVAQYDQLTDLPNRELFRDRLEMAITMAHRNGTRLGLLYLDLDRFKQVNDSVGHATGDLLLREVAQRIKGCVRKTDTVARIGGDEFVVVLHQVARQEDAAQVAEMIRQALDQPFDVAGHRLHISCSVGIALFPDHGDDNRQLIRHADHAMYTAKQQGGNSFVAARVLQEAS